MRWGTAVERQNAAPTTMSSGVSAYSIFVFFKFFIDILTLCFFVPHSYCPFDSLFWRLLETLNIYVLCHLHFGFTLKNNILKVKITLLCYLEPSSPIWLI